MTSFEIFLSFALLFSTLGWILALRGKFLADTHIADLKAAVGRLADDRDYLQGKVDKYEGLRWKLSKPAKQ